MSTIPNYVQEAVDDRQLAFFGTGQMSKAARIGMMLRARGVPYTELVDALIARPGPHQTIGAFGYHLTIRNAA